MKKKELGLSLVELLVVLAIAGIILNFAISSYQNYLLKAKAAKYSSIGVNLKVQVLDNYFNGLSYPNLNRGTKSYDIDDKNYKIHLHADIYGIIRGVTSDSNGSYIRKLVFYPIDSGTGSIVWICESFGYEGATKGACIEKEKNDAETVPNDYDLI